MQTFAQFVAPLMLLFPAIGLGDAAPESPVPLSGLEPLSAEQVSIQRRITVRVSPQSPPMPTQAMMLESTVDAGQAPRFVERKMGNCLDISSIAGVQAIDNSRLLLILHDRRMVTAKLEKGCQGREFYSGFIVARNADSQICVGRDRLLSRSGMGCQVSGFKQLVQVSD